MTAPAATPPTRSEWVDGQLRRAILSGEFAPGEKLRAEHLAERWGVSPTPLRESLMRLAGEGFVVIEPQRGARVAPLDVAAAVEIYELRLLLDPVALDRSIVAGGEALVATVDEAYTRMTRRHADVTDRLHAHRDFHLALVSHCPNRRMVRQVEQLLDHSQRFQAIGVRTVRRGDPADEHRRLVEAVRAGDRRLAAETLEAHLRATLDAVRAAV
ncbi:MAG: GntR family transcriptional regulator [Ilumatobacteraceae bacterium]